MCWLSLSTPEDVTRHSDGLCSSSIYYVTDIELSAFHSHNNLWGQYCFLHFTNKENWGSDNLSDLPKGTQLGSGGARFKSMSLIPTSVFSLHGTWLLSVIVLPCPFMSYSLTAKSSLSYWTQSSLMSGVVSLICVVEAFEEWLHSWLVLTLPLKDFQKTNALWGVRGSQGLSKYLLNEWMWCSHIWSSSSSERSKSGVL